MKSTITKALLAAAMALLTLLATSANQSVSGDISAKISGSASLGYHEGGSDPFPPSVPGSD